MAKGSFMENSGGGGEAREFDLADIISVYHGVLASADVMDSVYKTLNHMTDSSLFKHELSSTANYCKPYIEAQFPAIKDIDISTLTNQLENTDFSEDIRNKIVENWVTMQKSLIGQSTVKLYNNDVWDNINKANEPSADDTPPSPA